MNKEVKKEDRVEIKSEETKKRKLTKEEYKEKFRQLKLDYVGRIFIDEKYKKPGKILRIDRDDAATRQQLDLLGYEIVRDESIKVGSGSLNESSSLGSTVQIEMGINGSDKGILYEIDEEAYLARMELEAEENKRIFTDEVDKHQEYKK